MRNRFKELFSREDFCPYRLRAAYTIEAAAVMGICMIFIGLLFIGGIHLYSSAMQTLSGYEREDIAPQDLFRLSLAISDIIDGPQNDKGVKN